MRPQTRTPVTRQAIQAPIHRSETYGDRSLAAGGKPSLFSWSVVSLEQPVRARTATTPTADAATLRPRCRRATRSVRFRVTRRLSRRSRQDCSSEETLLQEPSPGLAGCLFAVRDGHPIEELLR